MFINPQFFFYIIFCMICTLAIYITTSLAICHLHPLFPSVQDMNGKKPRSFHHFMPLPVPLLLPEMSCQFIQLSNYKLLKIFSINCLKPQETTLPPLSYLFQSLGVSWLLSSSWHAAFDIDFHYNTITGYNNVSIIIIIIMMMIMIIK